MTEKLGQTVTKIAFDNRYVCKEFLGDVSTCVCGYNTITIIPVTSVNALNTSCFMAIINTD